MKFHNLIFLALLVVSKKQMCINFVHDLEISRCDSNGNTCDIYITRYKIDDSNPSISIPSFKNAVRGTQDGQNGVEITLTDEEYVFDNNSPSYGDGDVSKKAFLSATKDYILSLPNFSIAHHATGANFRVIVVVHHTKDGNDYYSFSTMEVIR